MSDCLFFLHPSIATDDHPQLYSSDETLSQIIESICRRFESVDFFAWVNESDTRDGAAERLQRRGFSLARGTDPAEWLRARLRGPHADTTLIIAAGSATQRELLQAVDHGRAEVWSTEEATSHPASQRVPAALAGAATECSVFIDWAYLEQVGAVPPEGAERTEIAEHLLSLASLAGRVVDARAYRVSGEAAFGGIVEEGGVLRVCSGSLREDLAQAMAQRATAHTWLVMAPTRSLPPVSAAARQRGHRMILCQDGEPYPDAETSIDARRLLHGFRLPARSDSQPPAEPDLFVDASIGQWVRLAYYLDCAQRHAPSGRLDYSRLVATLSQQEEYGLNADAAEGAVRRAMEFGLIQQLDDRSCRLNSNHAAARFAIEVPERVLRLLNQMLQRMPWVSFKLLRGVLAREQWLGGPAYGLEESQIDDWINFLLRDGALTMTKEPNLVAPEFPVTALRVNPIHPLTGAAPETENGASSLSRERAILAVDHFLLRQHKPWMSMGALRRALERLGRDELQEVLRNLQSAGALVTERYPNPQREQPTTGCRLRHNNPLVAETLATRNTLLRAAAQGEGAEGWTPLSRLELVFEKAGPVSEARHRAWLRLLLDEGILELSGDPDDLVRGGAHVLCRANRHDPVVRSIVGDEPEPVAAPALKSSAAPPSFRSLTRRPIEPAESVVAN